MKIINKNQQTLDNLLILKNVVKKYVMAGKKKLCVCFVDFKWHKTLFGIKVSLIRWRETNSWGNIQGHMSSQWFVY